MYLIIVALLKSSMSSTYSSEELMLIVILSKYTRTESGFVCDVTVCNHLKLNEALFCIISVTRFQVCSVCICTSNERL